MTDIFLSYTRANTEDAADIATYLNREDGWNVFWDRKIEAGTEWSPELLRQLDAARCVVVLWSRESRKSIWVQGEAAKAYERDAYLPVTLDDSEPPRLFGSTQYASVAEWVKTRDPAHLDGLRQAIQSRIGKLQMYGSLEKVADDEPVLDKHLHLVHSCWRVDRDTPFGHMPYQIHLIVFGHHSATKRIESVEYYLPGYPEGYQYQAGGSPERLFELKELANGFCVAQATVRLKDTGYDHPRIVSLSRLINMTESGPRLFDDFIRRSDASSRLGSILFGLPEVQTKAEKLLASLDEVEVKRRLVNDGYPETMVDAAVASAAARLRRD